MLAVKVEAECRMLFSSNYYLDRLKSKQILEFELPVSDLQWFS